VEVGKGSQMKKLILASAFAIALGRVFITPRLTNIPSIEGGYEALAHLLVGFMILVPFYDRRQSLGNYHFDSLSS
jgi:hypothetical protein